MSKKPFPKVITGAVVTTIAAAALVTFTRGDSPRPDTASARVPGVSGTTGPIIAGTPATPTPSSPASADAAEREAKVAGAKGSKSPTATPTPTSGSGSTAPTSTSPPAKDPDPTEAPPSPAPAPSQPSQGGLGDLLGTLLGGGGN